MGKNIFFHQLEVGINSVPAQPTEGMDRGLEAVAMDMTNDLAHELAHPETTGRPLGFVLRGALNSLGLSVTPDTSPTHAARINVRGVAADLPKRSEELFLNRDRICNSPPNNYPGMPWETHYNTRGVIAALADQLSVMPPKDSLMYALGTIIMPQFTERIAGNDVTYVLGRRSGEWVKADEKPLGRYDTYDIGGRIIDRLGRPPLDQIPHDLRLERSVITAMCTIAEAHQQTPLADTFRESFVGVNDLDPEPFAVLANQTVTETPKVRIPIRVPRQHCQTAQKIAEMAGCTPEFVLEQLATQYAHNELQNPNLQKELEKIAADHSKMLP